MSIEISNTHAIKVEHIEIVKCTHFIKINLSMSYYETNEQTKLQLSKLPTLNTKVK